MNSWKMLLVCFVGFLALSCIEEELPECAEDEQVVYDPYWDDHVCEPREEEDSAICETGEYIQCTCSDGASGEQYCLSPRRGFSECACSGFYPIEEPEPSMPPEPDIDTSFDPLPVVLNVPLILQDTNVWCWAAVAEMVIRYRNNGLSLEQCEMLTIGYYGTYDTTCCFYPESCLVGGNWQHIANILYYVGGSYTQVTSPLAPEELYETLSADLPVIIQIRSGITTSHFVVVYGMAYESSLTSEAVRPVLLVNDPLSWITYAWPYDEVANIWMGSMIVY